MRLTLNKLKCAKKHGNSRTVVKCPAGHAVAAEREERGIDNRSVSRGNELFRRLLIFCTYINKNVIDFRRLPLVVTACKVRRSACYNSEYRLSAVNGHLLTVQCATVNAAAGGNVQKPLVGDGGYDKTYTVYMSVKQDMPRPVSLDFAYCGMKNVLARLPNSDKSLCAVKTASVSFPDTPTAEVSSFNKFLYPFSLPFGQFVNV